MHPTLAVTFEENPTIVDFSNNIDIPANTYLKSLKIESKELSAAKESESDSEDLTNTEQSENGSQDLTSTEPSESNLESE